MRSQMTHAFQVTIEYCDRDICSGRWRKLVSKFIVLASQCPYLDFFEQIQYAYMVDKVSVDLN